MKKMMEETLNTGVIYLITNTVNNKKYVGKANSYVKNGKQGIIKHGSERRFYKHKKAAMNGEIDIPLLYDDMRIHGENNFIVETLEVCLIENLRIREEFHVRRFNTHIKEFGYNKFIGDHKPEDEEHKKEYEDKKVKSNKIRAEGGAMRKRDDTVALPQNIYKRERGYFAQIKIGETLHNKLFSSSKDTDEEKLNKTIAWLEQIKLNNA